MADIKNFSSEEIITIIGFYYKYDKIELIRAIISNFPLSVLQEILKEHEAMMEERECFKKALA